MKKILFILCAIAIMLCIFTVTAGAEAVTDSVSEATSDILSETVSTANEGASPTLFTRIWEYCVENKTEMLGLSGDAVIFVLAIFVKLRNDKRTKSIANDLKIVKYDASGTASSQSSVVGVVNNMIEGYNEMRQSYDKYESLEDDRNRLVGAVMVQNTAILEILSTVYVNNKNMPQGVKDLVNLKYANCLKAIGNDEMLCDIVQAVRDRVSTDKNAESEEIISAEE